MLPMKHQSGPVPPTQGPGPKPAGEGPLIPPAEACQNKAGCMCERAGVDPTECQFFRAKPLETFALADFDQAQRVLQAIRETQALVKALAGTLPAAAEVTVKVDVLRQTLRSLLNRLDRAERGCMQLGLPI